jgi:competence protein ComEC
VLLQSVAVAWLAGSALAALGWPWWTVAIAGLLAVGRRPRLPWVVVIVAAVVLVSLALGGFSRYRASRPEARPGDVAGLIDSGPVRVRGVVEGDRDEHERALVLRLGVLGIDDGTGNEPASGTLLVRLPLSLNYDDGNLLEARGKIVQPGTRSGIDYQRYLQRQGIFAEMDYPATRLLGRGAGPAWRHELVLLRERLADGIASVLPEPEASLGAGIALGTRRVIEPSLNRALTETGTAQIVVASGYNITVVASLTLGALAWIVGRRWASLLTLLAIAAYAVFVGLYPSVLRAAIMGAIVLFAGLAGRPHSGMRALLIASAGMVAVSPRAVTDLSFLLSVFGTAGLFVLAQPLTEAMERALRLDDNVRGVRVLGRGAVAAGATTLAAMAGSLPIMLASFQTLSLSAIPANLILFPFVPAIMASSAATAIAGAIWQPAAVVLAPVAYALLAGMVFVVRACAQMPGSQIQMGWFGVGHAVVVFGIAATAWWSRRWWREAAGFLPDAVATRLHGGAGDVRGILAVWVAWPARAGSGGGGQPLGAGVAVGLIVAAVAMGVVAGMPLAARAEPPRMTITYLDVGQGSAMLVQSGRERVLIDGGPPGEATVRALDRVLPPWQRSLNLVVVTERSAGHIGGLPSVMRRYRVGAVVDASAAGGAGGENSPTWTNWQDALAATQALKLPQAPQTALQLGDASLVVQGASAATPGGVSPVATVIARLGDHRLVLAGDAGVTVDADVRTVSRGNIGVVQKAARILVVEPEQATAPASRAAEPLQAAPGTLVYRTTENGDVAMGVTGEGVHVHVSRGPRLGLGGGR